jgi:hypothetical protein
MHFIHADDIGNMIVAFRNSIVYRAMHSEKNDGLTWFSHDIASQNPKTTKQNISQMFMNFDEQWRPNIICNNNTSCDFVFPHDSMMKVIVWFFYLQ